MDNIDNKNISNEINSAPKNTVTQKSNTKIIIIGAVIVSLILVLGNVWLLQGTQRDTEKAVRTVSHLYMSELASRREQVVGNNLDSRIEEVQAGIDLMTDNDLSDKSHLEAYQKKMKKLYHLERFAFVDTKGLIYTSTGTQTNIDDYNFDHTKISKPEISILNLDKEDKKVIVALPVSIPFQNERFTACFMQIDMDEMLEGISMTTKEKGATFCNLYTRDGVALTNKVLGGLAQEDNLIGAMQHAKFDKGYSYDQFAKEFKSGKSGKVSFTYNGIQETLKYVPVANTDWMLTYLIRESVISQKISSVSNGIIKRNILQSVLLIAALIIMFGLIISQSRKNSKLVLEKETADAENRVKQQEMEQQIALKERLLEEEKQRTEQDQLINSMAADYRSVFYIDLSADEASCYRNDSYFDDCPAIGEKFSFTNNFTFFCNAHVTEQYREGFLEFIKPENIRKALMAQPVIVYRFLEDRDGRESYAMLRIAGDSNAKPTDENDINIIGAAFSDIDEEMRESLAQQQILSNALETAEQASKAKTSFLSTMSHEIRTPMNAIIGLDSIALNDPDTPEKTRDYLEKIGASADYLLQLINDILDMSRIESGRMLLKNEEFSFSKLLENINTMFSGQASDNGLDYQCHIDGEIGNYYIGDDMKLRQVLTNILGNAVKFTPEGGSISVNVKRIAQFDGKSSIRFTISDTGIGMSKEYLPKLFDTFSQEDSSNTTKHGSSGLGMAITKNIVEMMNGYITVESEKGKGTTFLVTVTLSDSTRDDREIEEDLHPAEMNVLIVDDDPVACEHAKLVLEKAGIASDTAPSGAKAIELIQLRHTRMDPYSLILVDWKMPEMDGIETTRRIREIIGNETGIIILTAYRWDEVIEEGMAAGVDSFIPKPLFAETVMDEFRSAMRRKGIMPRSVKPGKAELAGRRVLLAEDVPVNAEIMMMALKMKGIEADLAENGRIAVDKYSEHEPGYYSAILMDIRMPEMDGLEATRTIRAMDRPDASEIPIIALTANAFDEDVQRSLQAGLNAHLSKPLQPAVLFETLEDLITD